MRGERLPVADSSSSPAAGRARRQRRKVGAGGTVPMDGGRYNPRPSPASPHRRHRPVMTAAPPATDGELASHTPMMQQYPRVTFRPLQS